MQIWEQGAPFLGPVVLISHFYTRGREGLQPGSYLGRKRGGCCVFGEVAWVLAQRSWGLVLTGTGNGKSDVFSEARGEEK